MNEITSSQTFSLTPSAGARITTLLTSEAAPYFRVSVDGGGCSGFMYKYEFIDQPKEKDKTFEFDDVKICIDIRSYLLLTGMEIDYEED